MGLFSSLFGNPISDAAQKARQDALNAFNSIKTPELTALQVQLDKYVQQGTITPEQAEATLLQSNAFNAVKDDPSLVGAQKQALQQLQDIGTQGGMTAVDKAQLNDITNTQNQEAQSRLASIQSNAKERGVGGSGLELAGALNNEQAAADRAANSGVQVAANAQQRALAAIQAGGTQAGQMQAAEYGEQANKAQAQNALDQFNANVSNSTNMYNTQAANAAQAANLAAKQATSNSNADISNTNKEYNAQQNQTVYNDQLQKAQGIAGIDQNSANADQAAKNAEMGANLALTGGLLKAGAGAAGAAAAGPAGGAVTSQSIGSGDTTNSSYKMNPDGSYNFAQGGQVPSLNITPKDEEDFDNFISEMKIPKMSKGGQVHMGTPSCYCGGGKCMSQGGFLKDLKKGALHQDLGVPSDKPIPSGKLEKATHSTDETLRKRAQFAENAKHWNHSDGGEIKPAPSPSPEPKKEDKKNDPGLIERIGNLLGAHADAANKVDKNPYDFKTGGKVPGIPKVTGDSPKNDTVPAMLSPGEIVVPRTMAKKVETGNDQMISSALHSLINHKKKEVK